MSYRIEVKQNDGTMVDMPIDAETVKGKTVDDLVDIVTQQNLGKLVFSRIWIKMSYGGSYYECLINAIYVNEFGDEDWQYRISNGDKWEAIMTSATSEDISQRKFPKGLYNILRAGVVGYIKHGENKYKASLIQLDNTNTLRYKGLELNFLSPTLNDGDSALFRPNATVFSRSIPITKLV